MPLRATFSAALVDLKRALKARDWSLIGAQVATIYGSTRTTQDIDLSVFLDPKHWPELVQDLLDAGFIARIPDALEFAERTRVLLLQHQASEVDIDLVLAGPGLETLFLGRKVTVPVFDLAVPVLCVEDLIASKVFAGRPRDLDDLRAVLRRTPFVAQNVVETLRLLESALDRSDLVSCFHALQDDLGLRRGKSNHASDDSR